MPDLQKGDRITAKVANGTPGGLTVEGEVLEVNDTTVRVTTQFGIDMRLPLTDVKPINA